MPSIYIPQIIEHPPAVSGHNGLIDCVIDAPGHLIDDSAQRMTVG